MISGAIYGDRAVVLHAEGRWLTVAEMLRLRAGGELWVPGPAAPQVGAAAAVHRRVRRRPPSC